MLENKKIMQNVEDINYKLLAMLNHTKARHQAKRVTRSSYTKAHEGFDFLNTKEQLQFEQRYLQAINKLKLCRYELTAKSRIHYNIRPANIYDPINTACKIKG